MHQGKGTDDTAAQMSAIMEAIEFAVAEAPSAPLTMTSIEAMASADISYFVPTRLLPGDHVVDRTEEVAWINGRCLSTGETVLVPLDSVALAPRSHNPWPFSQSSNGLGAGFAFPEAAVHGLCELIERDASTLWYLGTQQRCTRSAIAFHQSSEPRIREVVDRVERAGFHLMAFDLTTDLGVPTVMALLWSGRPRAYFDVASGVCAHPSSVQAFIGAVEEAAQTRISNIAGSRDDIDPGEYDRPLPQWIDRMIACTGEGTSPLPTPMLPSDFNALVGRMAGRSIAVELSEPGDEIVVVKVLSETLEDRSTNVHWRPGSRAMTSMARL